MRYSRSPARKKMSSPLMVGISSWLGGVADGSGRVISAGSGSATKEKTLSPGVDGVGVSIAIFSLAAGSGSSSGSDSGSGWSSLAGGCCGGSSSISAPGSAGSSISGAGSGTSSMSAAGGVGSGGAAVSMPTATGRLPLPSHSARVNNTPRLLAAGVTFNANSFASIPLGNCTRKHSMPISISSSACLAAALFPASSWS